MLQSSPVFATLHGGHALVCNYEVNSHPYTREGGYYVADGNYARFSIFVKTIPNLLANKIFWFATQQESCRIDVEHTFVVL
jgi:hypothetical protein